mgnify:FL=1
MRKNRLQEAEMAVLAILKKGRANAMTGKEIATTTGYKSRLIYSAISNLVIRYGVPIIGVRVGIRSGYYIAETKEELLEGLISLKNQVKNEQKRLDVLMSIEDVTAYEKILEYVSEHTGLKVSHLYILQAKQEYGIIERGIYLAEIQKRQVALMPI